ncbi:MAG: putative lipid II flippase FtsW [Dehalococcoidia bacterium]|nr:putative lipid II flippase FtsW [Dehalococcoidia bacterium]
MTVRTPQTRQAPKPPDYVLLVFVGGLILLGLHVVYSATFALAITEYDSVVYFLVRQAIWAAVGAVLLLICLRINYHFWGALSPFFVILAAVMLVLVLVPALGVDQYGAQRWLRLGPLPPVQPSEFVKLGVILGLATWLSGPGDRAKHFKTGMLPVLAFILVFGFLIMKQPDMGTALVMVLIALTMYFLAGADLVALGSMVVAGFGAGMALIMAAGYRSERLQSYIDPWKDPSGLGFHIIQLLIALGSGGLFGLGVGASRQKFFYVPGAHTDGIFAIIGEELGFVGCLAVILLFAGVVYRGARIMQDAPDRFGSLLAAGIVSWIAFQALINIGGITRSIPLTGIPLPFISYGGSSLAATMAAIGILLNISRYRQTHAAAVRPVARHVPPSWMERV